MSNREESLVAVQVAAEQLLRALRWPLLSGPSHVIVPVGLVAQLASAVGAVAGTDAEGAHTGTGTRYAAPCASETGQSGGGGAEGRSEGRSARTPRVDAARDRPGLCAVPECFRVVDLPTGTCFHHSPAGQRLRPFEQIVMRDRLFAVGEDRDG